jgi:hypothetical protein
LKAPDAGRAPPRIPFALTVGVTGHRLDAIPAEARGPLEARIAEAMALIEEQARTLGVRHAALFTGELPIFTLVSPLADGTDQMAADAGLKRGWRLQAALPFDRATYLGDFPDAAQRAQFEDLLGKAECILELPGDPDDRLDAYVMAGRATVAHCDLMIAAWDGLPPRGRGGTGEIVDLAVARGTPIVHLPVDPDQPAMILWAAFDPNVLTRNGWDRGAQRPFEAAQVERLLTALLAPPPDAGERRFYGRFLSERPRRIRGRLEYPLLLALAGIARLDSSKWRESRCAAVIEEEWQRFMHGCGDRHGVSASLDLLQRAYGWSDRLAGYYAQNFRSGHVFNFVLAASAVLLGLSAFALPASKLELAIIEFFVALAVIFNTQFGISHEWHRRWLDYRQLAERLRPLRSLKLLGIASPDPPGTAANPVARRWIDWYAAGVWRAMGCPHGRIDQEQAGVLADAISCHEIAPQISYHEDNARQIDALDRRLELVGTGLFVLTLISSVIVIAGLMLAPEWVASTENWFTLLSAGLPAVGTAIFGIRFQGDFGGSAVRSRSTANTLRAIETQLATDKGNLSRSADLIEQSARAMLADLDEWRLINQQHDLSVG